MARTRSKIRRRRKTFRKNRKNRTRRRLQYLGGGEVIFGSNDLPTKKYKKIVELLNNNNTATLLEFDKKSSFTSHDDGTPVEEAYKFTAKVLSGSDMISGSYLKLSDINITAYKLDDNTPYDDAYTYLKPAFLKQETNAIFGWLTKERTYFDTLLNAKLYNSSFGSSGRFLKALKGVKNYNDEVKRQDEEIYNRENFGRRFKFIEPVIQKNVTIHTLNEQFGDLTEGQRYVFAGKIFARNIYKRGYPGLEGYFLISAKVRIP